jgi:ketosteroid isomerase-like protein
MTETLVQRDLQFDAAVSAGDLATLAALIADDFIYTHSTGQIQSRAEYLAALGARQSRSQRAVSNVRVEIHADIGITSGDLTITYPSTRPPHLLRYLRVHRRIDGVWQAISHRTLIAPPTAG